MNGILSRLGGIGVTVRGIYGEGTKVMGDFYQLSNSTCLGRNEAQTVADMQNLLSELIKKEQMARRELCSGERKLRLQDLVYRSIGTLSHARSISFEETMQHLSYARMGLSLEWTDLKADLKTVNELLVLTQPMHIQMLAGKSLDACDRDFLRATLLRKKFK
jgi:protein arginine kinase